MSALHLLLDGNIRHVQLWVFVIPVGGDMLEGEAERPALAGGQRRGAQVDCLRVRTRVLKDMQGNVFRLGDLAERVFEADVDHGMVTVLSAALVTVPSR